MGRKYEVGQRLPGVLFSGAGGNYIFAKYGEGGVVEFYDEMYFVEGEWKELGEMELSFVWMETGSPKRFRGIGGVDLADVFEGGVCISALYEESEERASEVLMIVYNQLGMGERYRKVLT